ncbi:hypothetical protein BDM02DRAFT_3131771 [Thelephora ganbajun]|uniref:Uncharacterized protein n=1 Tax=Thelephora ganbajun TaxID=370292 RepID=A0ACB6Z4G6_THEGA|nr:hypothetical protein BDM02DRAFT_3131771 [Thelephora ganbajun]
MSSLSRIPPSSPNDSILTYPPVATVKTDKQPTAKVEMSLRPRTDAASASPSPAVDRITTINAIVGQTSGLGFKDLPPSRIAKYFLLFICLAELKANPSLAWPDVRPFLPPRHSHKRCALSMRGDRLGARHRSTDLSEMSLLTGNVIQDAHARMGMEGKTVNKQPTVVPNMTSVQQPTERADRLRGGCISCPVRPSSVFGLWLRFEKRTCRVDVAVTFPYLAAAAAADDSLLH